MSTCFFVKAQNKPIIKSPLRKITLKTCLEKAVANSFTVKDATLKIQASENNLELTKSTQYPSVASNFSNYFSAGRNIDPFTNQYTEQGVHYQNLGINASLNLLTNTPIKNQLKVNNLSIALSEKERDIAKQQLVITVIGAFFQVLNAQEITVIAQKQLETTNLQLKRAEILNKEGLSAKATLLDFEAQLATEELNLFTAENTLKTEKLKLLQLVNDDKITDFEVDATEFSTKSLDQYPIPLNRIVTETKRNQPSIEAANLKVQIANENLAIASLGYLPTVVLSMGLNTNYSSIAPTERFISDGSAPKTIESQSADYVLINGQKNRITTVSQVQNGSLQRFNYFNQLDFNLGKVIGVSVRMPIFNGFYVKIKTESAKITQLSAQNELKQNQVAIQHTIELAYNDLQGALRRVELLNKQLSASEKAFESVRLRFEQGFINSIEYTLSKSNLDRIRINQTQAKYEYFYRMSVLDFYLTKKY